MRHNKCWAIIGAAALLLVACLSTASASLPTRVVRVGVYDNATTASLANRHQPAAVLGKLLAAVANEENWTLEEIRCAWHVCLAALDSGKIDLLPDMAPSSTRATRYDFSQVPALRSWTQVYERRNGPVRSVRDLSDKRIAVLPDSVQYDDLAVVASGFGVNLTLVNAETLDGAFSMVAQGQADAVASSHYLGGMYAAEHGLVPTPINFRPSELFYATGKGRNADLLAAIDQHLQQWQRSPGSTYYQVLEQWSPATPSSAAIPPAFWWAIAALVSLLLTALAAAFLLRARISRQTRNLKASEARLNTILDSVDAHIYIKDCNLRYVYGNRRVCDLFGTTPEKLIGSTDGDFFDRHSHALLRKNDLRVTEHGERVVSEENNITTNGKTIETILSIKIPLRNSEGDVEALCGISTDITALRSTQRTAHQLAFYDPLTGLPNRRLLLDSIDRILEEAKQHARIGALLFVDLDHFKRINDARGHEVGDAVLCNVAQRLKDTFPATDVVARIGGDEFVVLLDFASHTLEEGKDRAIAAAGMVRTTLAQPILIKNHEYLVGGSIGATLLTPDSQSTADVLREADTAMYRAKEAGRNRVAFYESSMHKDVEDRLALEHDMSQAIGTDQFELQIQAQWDNAGRVVGAELLMRWNHPERGPISPDVFIPIAEDSGIIVALGDWALRETCAMLLQIKQAGKRYPLSINVSPRQFRQADFVRRVQQILHESGAPPDQLIFEVTEGVLIDDLQGSIDRMTELNDLGLRFSIDDFGTGYCSLAYLKRLPLYELKIDECFIRDTPANSDDVAIVKLILAMARQLNLQVVAEGIENHEQAEFLVKNNCDAMQGFLFSRPMAIADWLSKKAA